MVLFDVPLLVAAAADALLPGRCISISRVLAALVVVTIGFGLIYAFDLMKEINLAMREVAGSPPVRGPVGIARVLGCCCAEMTSVASATVVVGMAVFVAFDAV